MRPIFALLFLLSFFIHVDLNCQVTVLGKFVIGDTTNSYLLKTNRSDQFVGKVMSWTVDSLVFFTNSDIKVVFSPNEVNSIEILDKKENTTSLPEIFVLRTIDGNIYYGFPKRIMSNGRIQFVAGNTGTIRLKSTEIESIVPTTAMRLLLKEPFTNEYRLWGKKNKKIVGRMLGYQDGMIQIQDDKGMVFSEDIRDVKKYELNPQYTAYFGYGRSLLFLPTGFGMEKGEKQYRNIGLGINIVSVGFSDHISAGFGLVSILPYADIKFAQDLGNYIHVSVGAFAFVPFSAGFHGSISVGTPDYFLNLSFLRNDDFESQYSDSDFDSFGVGASLRVGRRSRVFAEFNIMSAPASRYGYDSFYDYGYGNSFSWGYGWFGRKQKFETGFMEIGPIYGYNCNTNTCRQSYHHIPIPYFAFSYNF
ncbi:MAG: hypothetical protein GC192_18740 [Bacteroidetes bacterium]|nr:hypothetical protein [Bacteroidota bacterium]